MNIRACKDETEWVEATNSWIHENAKRFSAQRIFIPAGETPRPVYASWERQGAPFAKTTRLVQIDDVLSGANRGTFKNFFAETLPSYQSQIEFIDQAGGGGDLALLGIGLNGHVGFHEPGLQQSFYSGCLTLNSETTARMKWPQDTRVVSYGVGAFLQAKAILLMVRGSAKKSILQEVLKPHCRLPAAHLKAHDALTILTDFEI